MARIRTIKPEAFESEDLASVDVTAMVTFFGLLTQADDHGRFRDHPAIIAGRLWALRADHNPADVARDLDQLAGAGLICRYTGCDGGQYLHFVTWEKHQKIDRASASRRPRCPVHQSHGKCSECDGASCPASSAPATTAAPTTPAELCGPRPQDSMNTRRTLDHTISPDSAPSAAPGASRADSNSGLKSTPPALQQALPGSPEESAGQTVLDEASTQLREGSASGSRILDPGSFPKGGDAPAPQPAPGSISAKDLLAEYVSACSQPVPQTVRGLIGRHAKGLLEEGFDPAVIRAALERLRVKGLHASVLPSLVNEALNASPSASASGAGRWASARPAYQPWQNPTDSSVYEESL
ncbi:hypothetical protein [Streptomyces sp. NBC_01233]|uniref:hypothetical protein n=1 Tax=Streptomyces sp. NBC_01233 TaxID=2903787 RepID=UPI002E11E27E|nr:hypothetical protein OG332_37400 [Streptomyces sp. NBC_01233]